MILNMYEANFGEAILMKQDAEDFVVDCGALFCGAGTDAADKIFPNLTGNVKTLLITHFDKDHYNGVPILADRGVKFNHIYLPLYMKKDDNGLASTWEVFEDTIKIWAYLKVLGRPVKLDALQNLFVSLPKLVDSIANISCVGTGDYMNRLGREFLVLWPEKGESTKRKTYASELRGIVNDFNNSSAEDAKSTEEITKAVEAYVRAFIKVYLTYTGNVQEKIVAQASFGQLMEDLRNTFKRLGEVSGGIVVGDDKIRRRISTIRKVTIKNMNECSVVFHNHEVLMLGDVTKKIYRHRISPKANQEYKVIKVAHHGTWSNYCKLLAKSKRYIISNSGNDKKNWLISADYEKTYPAKMMCTNTVRNKCKSVKRSCVFCKIGKGCGDIQLDISTL